MQLTLRIALIIVTALYIYLVLKQVKKNKLQTSYSIFWIITGIILIIALLIPNLIENISFLLGFKESVNMIFCLTIFIAFYLIFKLTVQISTENRKNVDLVQEVSILKKEVQELKNEVGEKNEQRD